MAADVSFVLQMMMLINKNGKEDGAVKTPATSGSPLVTRDLLGASCQIGSKELDLDSEVPFGWEKRLDMESGEVYLQRCTSTVIYRNTKKMQQDLNYPPPTSTSLSRPTDDSVSIPATTLDLTLNLSSTTSPSNSPPISNLSFICTLDRVKSALERVQKRVKRCSPSPASSGLSSEKKTSTEVETEEDELPSRRSLFAVGCPSCLMYVLISGRNPKCPRCDAVVLLPSSSPPSTKKPRLDL